MAEQQVLYVNGEYSILDTYIGDCNRILVVAGNSLEKLDIGKYLNSVETKLGIKVVRFSDFKPNPTYESVVEGVRIFRESNCDSIIAVGGGSAIDVAKCIKLFSNMNDSENYLTQPIIPNDIKFIAVPTTAGTGAEATRFAVIYYSGEKQSITDYSGIPSTVIFDSSTLKSLSIYQKKATMMDAFCHAIESYWSVNSNENSQIYSRQAIKMILDNYKDYLNNDDNGNSKMLEAAYIAGKAINITQTTAGHAMCYKLTGLYDIAHGHAAALCVSKLFPYMIGNLDKCIDPRGKTYLCEIFNQMADAMDCKTIEAASGKFTSIVNELKLEIPVCSSEDYEILVNSVNIERLKNNPVELDREAIDSIYHQILER